MISPIEVTPALTPQLIKLIRVTQRSRKQVVFKLTDDSGTPVDLRAEVQNPPAALPDFQPQAAAVGQNVHIRLVAMPPDGGWTSCWDGSWSGGGDCGIWGSHRFSIPGKILDQEKYRGFVEFELRAEQTCAAGVFGCSVDRYVNGPHLVDTWPVLLAIEPPAMALLGGNGPIIIPEVRLALLDLDNQVGGNHAFSNLLDDVEFTDLEIVFAIRRVVDLWNETPPPVGTFSSSNFPYRYHWLQGTTAQLLIMGAARYRRNRLAYQAGGVAIDDQSKANEYEQTGQQRMQEFMTWMRNEKYRINMGLAWGIGL